MKPRTLLAAIAFLLLLAVAGWLSQPLLSDSRIWPPDDSVEYWAAGRLNLQGQNPYSPVLLLPLERSAGRETDEAVMMWNPPWTLSVAMPLGALPARFGQFAWLVLQAGSLVASALLLSRMHNQVGDFTVPLALTFTFVPTLFLLQSGQIAGLLVLGAALFAIFAQRGYPILAGVAAVLLAIKPHLAYLLWLAVAVDAIRHRRFRIVIGGILGGLVFTLVPLVFNPELWTEYFAAYRDHPPTQWVSLTLGSILRFAFGESYFWLSFVPMIFGVAWFLRHWRTHARSWNWSEQLPAILLVSFATSPYGAWHFDLPLLLIPMWDLSARLRGTRRGWALALFALANILMLLLQAQGVTSFFYAWVAPLVLLTYFGFRLPGSCPVRPWIPA